MSLRAPRRAGELCRVAALHCARGVNVTEPWQSTHSAKLATAAEAMSLVRPGRRILIGSGAAEPLGLVDALAHHADHLFDNEIVHLLTLGPAPYVKPELANRFRHTAFFIGPNVREAVQEGRADFIPVFLSEIPELIRSRRVRIDVALIQTSPPDAHGYVSLGVSVDVVRAAVDAADLVLAEVNPQNAAHARRFVPARLQDRPIDPGRFATAGARQRAHPATSKPRSAITWRASCPRAPRFRPASARFRTPCSRRWDGIAIWECTPRCCPTA